MLSTPSTKCITGMENVDREWAQTFRPMIRTIVADLMAKKPISVTVKQTMDGYTKCFNIFARRKLEAEVYDRFTYHQDAMMKEIVDQFRFDNLSGFLFYWNVFTVIIKWFKMFFYYLYRLRGAEFPFYDYFSDRYLQHHHRALMASMLDVYQLRQAPEYPVCAGIIDCLGRLNPSYVPEFEMFLREKNSGFYRQKYSIMLKDAAGNAHAYVASVRRFMETEATILDSYHIKEAWDKIRSTILLIFVDAQSAWVKDVFMATIRSRRVEEIKNLYFFLHFGHRSEMYSMYGTIMQEMLTSFDKGSCVRDILRLRNDETRFINEVLEDQQFHTVLRESIRKYVNTTGHMDHIVRFMDKTLRDGATIEWADVFDVFGLLADKDVFSQKYRECMTYRLLDRYDENAEVMVLEHMEQRTGASYVFPMRTMLNEMRLNSTHSAVSGITRVTVISALQWSVRSDHLYDVRYPVRIARDMESFNEAYFQRYGHNKKLVYAPHLGRVEIRATYHPDTQYHLITTPIQALVLLALTDTPRTIDDIEQTVLRQQDASLMTTSILMSLKDLVVRGPDDTWTINPGFSYAKKVVRLPIPNLRKKHVQDQEDTTINTQRRYILDCLIVRTMKANRVMQHHDLVVEVMKQAKTFEPDVRMIKRQIENLIERDYMERHESSYKYIL